MASVYVIERVEMHEGSGIVGVWSSYAKAKAYLNKNSLPEFDIGLSVWYTITSIEIDSE